MSGSGQGREDSNVRVTAHAPQLLQLMTVLTDLPLPNFHVSEEFMANFHVFEYSLLETNWDESLYQVLDSKSGLPSAGCSSWFFTSSAISSSGVWVLISPFSKDQWDAEATKKPRNWSQDRTSILIDRIPLANLSRWSSIAAAHGPFKLARNEWKLS